MKQTIYRDDFIRAFAEAGRADQFSREALGVLFDHFEQWEDDTGGEVLLDVIALCCEFAEDTPEGVRESYDIGGDVVGHLEDVGAYIGTTAPGTIVYRQF